jgi:hypothetical protein
VANERESAVLSIQAFIHALDTAAPLLNEETIKLHIDTALGEFSEWRPLRKLGTLAMVSTNFDYALPSDFMSPDVESFNHAVNPAGLHYHWNGVQFELGYTQESTAGGRTRGMPGAFGITQPPYGSSQAVSFGISFPPGSRFEFGQLENGDPMMYSSPAPAQAASLKFMYNARHIITDDSGTDPEEVGFVAGVNTVKPEDRGLVWARAGQYAILSLARSVAANRYAPGALVRISKECQQIWDGRTRDQFCWAG